MKKKAYCIAIVMVAVLFTGIGLFSLAKQYEAASYSYYWSCNKGHSSVHYSTKTAAQNAGMTHQRSTGHTFYIVTVRK
ncbi:hypothetical protein [Enterococcus sp. BWR-S5]|uniref:hypothetical protein n=1 Tax=Enterococcus sp. BWR-S5 TaxID=2787714 RepID=UPI0019215CA2|nr:hypothetical protein [Enterococcus sp. BWR-S5]MBL1226616.1 hypothetical protein [Enterococcus sp. BWR-S5]